MSLEDEGHVSPENFQYDKTVGCGNPKNPQQHTQVSFATEDIIALGAVVVAVIIALGMVAGKLPVNAATIGLASFSVVCGGIAKILKAQRSSGIKHK